MSAAPAHIVDKHGRRYERPRPTREQVEFSRDKLNRSYPGLVRFLGDPRKKKAEHFPQTTELFETVTDREMREIGKTGILRVKPSSSKGGLLPHYESNPEMRPYLARGRWADLGVYHDMRTDGIINGLLSIEVMVIKDAPVRVTTALKPTEPETLGAEMIKWFLGLEGHTGQLERGRRRFISNLCQGLLYGFSPNELTWSTTTWTGLPALIPSRIRYRAPQSVEGWVWDGEDLIGLMQLVQTRENQTHPDRVFIPIDRLALYSHAAVDGNPEGISKFRSAYMPWKVKEWTIKRDQMARQRLFGGINVVKELGDEKGPFDTISDTDFFIFNDMFQRLLSGEIEFVFQPYGLELDMMHPEFKIDSPVEMLRWADHQILMSGSAGLLGLDASNSASAALSDGLGSVMFQGFASDANDIYEVVNDVLAKMLRANIPEANDPDYRMPRAEPFGIEHRDIGSLMDALAKAEQFRIITPDAKDENIVRPLVGLPRVVEEDLQARRDAVGSTQTTQDGGQNPQSGPVT